MEFPDLGAHCALTTCKRLDFLPVKCAGCKSVFCGEHFSPLAHSCAVAAVRDARVPVCPLCDAPVPVRRKGDAPDVAVSAHIDADCQSDPAVERRRKIFDQRCAVKKCKKKEMIRLQCNECGKNFCLSHRHPLDHSCEGKIAKVNPSLEAALARQNQSKKQEQQKKSQMESDEAFARALQESMQQERAANSQRAPAMTQEELDRLMALSLSQGMSEEEIQRQQRELRRQAQQQQQQQSGGSNSSCVMS